MGGSSLAKDHPWEYLAASALAATINYLLWRASAIGQSGFQVTASSVGQARLLSSVVSNRALLPYVYAFLPPYKGMVATVAGMTWARAAIFWGSDRGREALQQQRVLSLNPTAETVLPPLVVSTFVQCVNMPIVRASITLQDPQQKHASSTWESVRHIFRQHGLGGLWHGTSAGILKTVPKYCTAVVVKAWMDETVLPQPDPASPTHHMDQLLRSACKSVAAGVAGAALTNPLDVIRNEMFKTNRGLVDTVRTLHADQGYAWIGRGLGKNLIAVSIPVSATIFFTDALIDWTKQRERERERERDYDRQRRK